jgi:hypothetical protein
MSGRANRRPTTMTRHDRQPSCHASASDVVRAGRRARTPAGRARRQPRPAGWSALHSAHGTHRQRAGGWHGGTVARWHGSAAGADFPAALTSLTNRCHADRPTRQRGRSSDEATERRGDRATRRPSDGATERRRDGATARRCNGTGPAGRTELTDRGHARDWAPLPVALVTE